MTAAHRVRNALIPLVRQPEIIGLSVDVAVHADRNGHPGLAEGSGHRLEAMTTRQARRDEGNSLWVEDLAGAVGEDIAEPDPVVRVQCRRLLLNPSPVRKFQ